MAEAEKKNEVNSLLHRHKISSLTWKKTNQSDQHRRNTIIT